MRGRSGGSYDYFGPGERTRGLPPSEIDTPLRAAKLLAIAWPVFFVFGYVFGTLLWIQAKNMKHIAWTGYQIQEFYVMNWAILVAVWLLGPMLAAAILVYRFFMEVVFKDWLPHPEKPEIVYAETEQEFEEIPPQLYQVSGHAIIGKKHVYTGFSLTKEGELGLHKMCKAIIADDRLNFSSAEAKRHGIEISEWKKIIEGFAGSGLAENVGPRLTPRLTAAGRAMVRNFANTTPPARN